jgi:hypothetical protein
MLRRNAAVVLSLILCGAPLTSARAVDLTPYVGAVVPTKTMVISSSTFIRMQTHTVYGIAASTPLAGRIGLELAAGVGTGKMELVAGLDLEFASTLLLADARARVRLAGGEQTHVALLAGVGYTRYKVGYFDYANEVDDETKLKGELTGLVGIGVRGALGDRMRLSIDAMDRIHDTGIELPSVPGARIATQHDIMFTAGLTFPLSY